MNTLLLVLRWAARLSALVIAGGYALLMVGEMSSSPSGPPSTLIEWAGILLLATAVIAMLIAWRWELLGGAISLAMLGVVALFIRGSATFHRSISVMAIPGVLYCIDWLVRRAGAGKRVVASGF